MTKTNREFTGRHMLMVMIAFFGVIISVNMVMATFALSEALLAIIKKVDEETRKSEEDHHKNILSTF